MKIRDILHRLFMRFHLLPVPESPAAEIVYSRLSYAQEGEDMILAGLFEGKNDGFYIDVGAYHPYKFSNTYYFYLQGWQGINIDATPGSMKSFNQIRSRDINLEIAVSDSRDTLTYYCFKEPALNTFCKKLADFYIMKGWECIAEQFIPVYPLSEVLEHYLPTTQSIDFLTIDVEGLDYNVLKSNNWFKYRPEIILIEDLNCSSLQEVLHSEITELMTAQKYELYGKAIRTLFFKSTHQT